MIHRTDRQHLICVSMNELSSVLKRALEGRGFAPGDYEDAATMVLWLETHGLGGLEILRRAWARLGGAPTRRCEKIATQPGHHVLDAGQQSVLLAGPAAVDLACANARASMPGSVELRNCRDRQMIIGALAVCAARGLSALAHWHDGDAWRLVWFDVQASCPACWRLTPVDAAGVTRHSLLIVCGDPGVLNEQVTRIIRSTEPGTRVESIAPDGLQTRYDEALENGLTIDNSNWRWLSGMAEAVLVEASERSRHGAGEEG